MAGRLATVLESPDKNQKESESSSLPQPPPLIARGTNSTTLMTSAFSPTARGTRSRRPSVTSESGSGLGSSSDDEGSSLEDNQNLTRSFTPGSRRGSLSRRPPSKPVSRVHSYSSLNGVGQAESKGLLSPQAARLKEFYRTKYRRFKKRAEDFLTVDYRQVTESTSFTHCIVSMFNKDLLNLKNLIPHSNTKLKEADFERLNKTLNEMMTDLVSDFTQSETHFTTWSANKKKIMQTYLTNYVKTNFETIVDLTIELNSENLASMTPDDRGKAIEEVVKKMETAATKHCDAVIDEEPDNKQFKLYLKKAGTVLGFIVVGALAGILMAVLAGAPAAAGGAWAASKVIAWYGVAGGVVGAGSGIWGITRFFFQTPQREILAEKLKTDLENMVARCRPG